MPRCSLCGAALANPMLLRAHQAKCQPVPPPQLPAEAEANESSVPPAELQPQQDPPLASELLRELQAAVTAGRLRLFRICYDPEWWEEQADQPTMTVRTGPGPSASECGVRWVGDVLLADPEEYDEGPCLRVSHIDSWAARDDTGLPLASGHCWLPVPDGPPGLTVELCEAADISQWSFADSLEAAGRLGVHWQTERACRGQGLREVPSALRPVQRPLPELSGWADRPGDFGPGRMLGKAYMCEPDEEDTPADYRPHPPKAVLATAPTRGDPRLALGMLTRGMRPQAMESFLLWHFGCGFERIFVYFDAPSDPAEHETIAMAESFGQGAPLGPDGLACRAEVHRCDERWWAVEEQHSRFFREATAHGRERCRKWMDEHQRKQQGAAGVPEMKRMARDQPWSACDELIEMHEHIHDVQARQQLVIEHACRAAHEDGLDWILHIDSDELLYTPHCQDARSYFGRVPEETMQIRFHNLEVVPESLDVVDCFEQASLFKLNSHLLKGRPVVNHDPMHRRRNLLRAPTFNTLRQSLAKGAESDADSRLLDVLAPALHQQEQQINQARIKLNRYGQPLASYFNAYNIGKCAARVRCGLEPHAYVVLATHSCVMPGGVHVFCANPTPTGGLPTMDAEGVGAPVVLHYANCGFQNWKQKYEMLCSGHKTHDNAFLLEKKIVSLSTHMASRDLLMRSQQDSCDEDELRRYYEISIMGRAPNELPYLAQSGLLVRINTIADFLSKRRLDAN